MMNKYYDINNLLDDNGEPITITFENKHLMKINEILNNINSKYEDYYVQDIVSGDDLKLLLDYIIKIREYYNANVDKYEDLIVKYSNILDENQQLKEQKDDVVIKYIKYLIKRLEEFDILERKETGAFWYQVMGELKELLRMLGEIE